MHELSETRLARRNDDDRPGLLVWMFGLDKPSLTARPQVWGIVPTFRFWNRLDTARHQAPALALGVGLILVAHALLTWPLVLALGPLLALTLLLPIYMALGFLPLGLFERWLRREIAARRGR
ncbi:MAG: hypothetical protein JNL82_19235 [Myxococcales bacterium]|nr:hypothetical protein [Myxococcales bacterium]